MAERTRAARRVALLAAVALAAAPALLIAGPAQAHNYLVSSTPAEGDTLTELPDRFDITTNEALLDLGGSTGAFALQVTDADGLYYGDGCLDITGPSLSTAAELGAPGTYTVQWQVVSADGHSVSDEFAFEWAPAAASEESTGSTAPPVCGEGDDSAAPDGAAADEDGSTPVPAPSASDPGADSSTTAGASDTSDTTAAGGDQAGGSSDGLWIGAAVVAAALAGGGVLFARFRGRGRGTTER
ncbi:copper resistance CopC family protein [Planctomonas deserti]|uniref:copper resistance CopC family protein n=1 Tax=Planctomonas deserti TaxID=2144185 RepID=UPI000D39647C|nr:copper resistance CopC family protein [Planctomonas deserti]